MGELGFLGVDVPEDCGGLGLDKTTACIVAMFYLKVVVLQ